MLQDTITAVSTAPGEAALSVLRVSGPRAQEVAQRVFQAQKPLSDLRPRMAYRVQACDPRGVVMDDGLLLSFRGPHSYTGEDVVEYHGHGGLLVTQKVLESLLHAGARSAEPGEFTHRAFLNGKMDLTQAEAVMDLIHAQSTLALEAAHEQLKGAIGQEAHALKELLLPVLAHVEAYIDFPEEDISPDTGTQLLSRLGEVQKQARSLIASAEQGRILRHGARTVICGQPNVGKSSLLNLLTGFERAIVSPTAGTTRDTIEEVIQVHGFPLRLVDTAGLREPTGDSIEQIGMERTRRELERADLILEVVDASRSCDADNQRVDIPDGCETRHLLLLNKVDLGLHADWQGVEGIPFSCALNQGVEALRDAIKTRLMQGAPQRSGHLIAVNTRHRACFEKVAQHTAQAQAALMQGLPPEYIALDLREALQALGEVIGTVDVEQVLDVIFSSFCIGK